jgi:hypothetical protein
MRISHNKPKNEQDFEILFFPWNCSELIGSVLRSSDMRPRLKQDCFGSEDFGFYLDRPPT